jgi:hypothetical protein
VKRGSFMHRKVKRLAKSLGISRAYAFGLQAALVSITEQQFARGWVDLSPEELAEELGASDLDPETLARALVSVGMLDRCRCHGFRVHDWPDHADRTAKRREEVVRYGFLECYQQDARLDPDWYQTGASVEPSSSQAGTQPTPKEEEEEVATSSSSAYSTPLASPNTLSRPRKADGRSSVPVGSEKTERPAGGNGASPARSSRAASKTPQPPPPAWALKAHHALREATLRRWPGTPEGQGPVRSAREIASIRAPPEQVADDVRWYCDSERDGTEFLPECRSGRSFKVKYDKVRAARLRRERANGSAEHEAVENAAQDERVARLLEERRRRRLEG